MNLKYDAKAIGGRVKELRKARHMTQVQLALEFNVSPDTIRGYENGKTSINQELLVEMCTYFNVSMDFLYFGKAAITSDDLEISRIIRLLERCDDKEKHRAVEILKLVFTRE